MPHPLFRHVTWLRRGFDRMLAPFLALAFALLLAGTAVASPGAIPDLQPQDSQLLDQRGPEQAERLYPLGPLRRINGALRMEGRVQVHGTLASITWELPLEGIASQAFTAARQALQGAGAQLLFWCEGRECGESNLWANDILGNTRLLGSDDQQGFLLVRAAADQADTLVAVYSVLRGNRRVALHVETFIPNAPLGEVLPTPGTLLRQLRESGQLAFPTLGSPPADAWVALLARTLNLDSTLRVSLGGEGSDQWQAALVRAGIRASRLVPGRAAGAGLNLEIVR